MNRFFRFGMLLALLVILGSGFMALKIVFSESPDVEVPALAGLSMVEAVDSLEKLGLLAKVDQVDSTQEAGTVISQWPEAGEGVPKGKVVLLKVSKGGERLSLPDVRGLEFGEAVRRLSDGGFKVAEILRVADPLKAAGTVIAQNPAAPAMIPATTSVSLLVSEGEGKDGGLVPVPNLIGQPEETALEMLAQVGLSSDVTVRVRTTATPAGLVVGTAPRGGSKVPGGSKVTLRVAVEPTPAETSGTTEGQPPAETSPGETDSSTSVQEPAPSPTTQRVAPSPKPVPTSVPEPTKAPKAATPNAGEPRKVAKIRYQVPPLSHPLALRIEMADRGGNRVVKEMQAKGGEYLSLDVPFAGEARVTIYLGGEFVWQDRFE